jgi:hypothetical protein
MKKFIGGLALASLLGGAYACWFAADRPFQILFGAVHEADEDGHTPGDADYNAIRLGYHGDPTDLHVDPAWYVQAAREEARIATSVPRGNKSYMRSANSPLALDPAQFTLLGPQPLTGEGFGANRAAGRANVVVSDPDNTAVAWLGSDGGGIWKTTNCCSSTTTWTVKSDFPELASMAIDDITMDPGNHNVLYAGTGDLNYGSFSFGSAGVLKSTDRGETWSLLGTDVFTMMYPASAGGYPQYQAISKVVVDPNNSNNVIAGTKTGLYFSNDAGVNWTGPCYTNIYTGGGGAQRQDMTGLAAVSTGGVTKLYAAVGTRGTATPVQPDLNKNGANGVYSALLPPSGCPAVANWTLLNSGLPAGLGNGTPSASLGRIEMAVAPSDPQTLYAMIADISSSGLVGIYKTTNGGASWSTLAKPDGSAGADSGTKVGTQMWYDAGLTVSPTDPNIFFISTVELLVSKNGGATAAGYINLTGAYSGGPVHPDNHARAIVGGDPNKVINGNDGGVYYISNATTATSFSNATWTDMNNGLPTIEVYGGDITANFATSSTPKSAAGFQDNGSAYVTYSGAPGTAAWNANNGGDGFYSRIEPVFGTRFYSSIYNGAIYGGTAASQTSIKSSGWSGDRLNFITTFDIYRYGDTGVASSGCNATAGCTHLIYGSQRLWETATATNPTTTSWKVQTGDLTKNNLVIGSDNRSYINQLHYSFTDSTIAIVGTTDGNVQYVFNLGTGVANTASAVNVTGGNAVLPNRTISDVSTDPLNPLIGYAAVAGFAANTPATPGHVFQVTCTANCASFTWTDKTGNLPDIPADAIIPNPHLPNQVFVGTDWGLYYTDDISVASPVWQRFEGLPHIMVWSLTIDRGFTTLAAYTRGRGVWAWPLPNAAVGGSSYTVSANVASGNGTISPAGPQTVASGTVLSFTLTPAAGYHLGNVGGTCFGTLSGNVYTTPPVSDNCLVAAHFDVDVGVTHTVTPSVSGGNGTITPNTPQTVNDGATTQFTLTPNIGYHIVTPVGGTCGGSFAGSIYTTSAVTADCTVIASFAIDTHVVTPSVSGGNGAITPNTPQTVNYNATTQFTLTPNTGYHLVTPVGGTCGGSLAGNTFTTNAVTADCTVIASFAIDTHVVTPSVSGGNGTIGPSTPQTVNYNATTQFTLTPNTGYHLVTPVGGTCGGSITGSMYTTSAVTADCTVVASFAINTYTLTYAAGANGAISGSSPQTVNHGASGSAVTALPNTGFHFVQWSDASVTNPRQDTNVTQNISVTAQFAPNPPHHLLISTVPDGTAGAALGAITVTVVDVGNNPILGDANSITMTIAAGPANNFDAASTTTAPFANGVATFNNLIIDKAGSGYVLTASDAGDSLSVDSGTFAIAAGNSATLKFVPPPPTTITQGASLGNVTVVAYDAHDNVTSDSSTQVTLTAGSCSGTVLGSGTLNAGAITFATTQRFGSVANGVSLTAAAAASPPSAAASTFNVGADPDWLFRSGFEGCAP